MNYYTSTIPLPLAEKLKEKGMPIRIDHDTERTDATFGACFDWLIEKGIYIRIVPFLNRVKNCYWEWYINQEDEPCTETDFYFNSWHEAAEKAIEKALTLI